MVNCIQYYVDMLIRSDYENLSWECGANKKIRYEDHCSGPRGLSIDAVQ